MKTDEQRATYYPVFLKLRGRKCAVIGGGEVALRKVRSLLEHGARVSVISPELCPELAGMAAKGQIQVLQRNYQAGDLRDTFIVIAATDDAKVNRELLKEAGESKALVNAVDDPENCDFIVPSSVRRGDVTIAVSTGGRSPALARKIRSRLETEFGEEYAALALLADETRRRIKHEGLKTSNDRWQAALDLDRLTGLLRNGKREEAKNALLTGLGLSSD